MNAAQPIGEIIEAAHGPLIDEANAYISQARPRSAATRTDRGPAYDPEQPVAGFYRVRLRKGGPPVAVRIWLGLPIDPATDVEVEDRGCSWQCAVNSVREPLDRHWPGCAREPISQAEYDRILAESQTMDAESHFYDPRKPVDLLTAPTPF